MILVTPYYGDGTFLPLLEAWLAQYRKSGCRLPIIVITDNDAPLPEGVKVITRTELNCVVEGTVHAMRFDPGAIPHIVRFKRAFDIQGSLICQAIAVLKGLGCVVMDCDAFIINDPEREFTSIPANCMAMGVDPAVRLIKGLPAEQHYAEMNGGVLAFGRDVDTCAVRDSYCHLFNSLKTTNNGPLLEQVVWTMVWNTLPPEQRWLLDKSLNWSHQWKDRMPSEVFIWHHHGPGKWMKIQHSRPTTNQRRIYA